MSSTTTFTEERTVNARYTFTDEELDSIALTLVHKLADKDQAEAEKKEVMDDYKHRLSLLTAEINDLARKRRDGFEMRPVRCRLERDFEAKKRQWVATEGSGMEGEVVREEPFNPEDYQMELADIEAMSERAENSKTMGKASTNDLAEDVEIDDQVEEDAASEEE